MTRAVWVRAPGPPRLAWPAPACGVCGPLTGSGINAYEASVLQRMQRFQAARDHARFFAVASRHAMVAAAMRTRYDQFGKQVLRDMLEGHCSVETDAEVPADTRRIDLWITPSGSHPARQAHRRPTTWVSLGASPGTR